MNRQYLLAEVLDLDAFEELRAALSANPGDLAAAYSAFLANASVLIDKLRTRESEPFGVLHTLKGSAAMLGATRIVLLAGELQDSFPEAPAETGRAIGELAGEIEMLRAVIARHLVRCGSQLDP